jgi:uncharacterized protein YjbI with pentapeptide repeats
MPRRPARPADASDHRPPPIEAPRVAPTLVEVEGEAVPDGEPVEGVAWTGTGPDEDVESLDLRASEVRGVRFTGRELTDLLLLDTLVAGCEWSGATVSGARWERVRFAGCRMSGLVADGVRARHVRFVDCQLDGAWLRTATFERCEFVDCDLTGADLHRARLLGGSRFLSCRLEGAEFSGAEVEGGLALHGSSLAGATGLATVRNLVIATDQVVDLALPLLAAQGITVDDDYDPDAPE